MRLNILLSVIVLGNVAVFSVGLKWSGREDSDSEKVASANSNSNGGGWQVAGQRQEPLPPNPIADKLATAIYTTAAKKIEFGRQFGFLYVNYDLNENPAVLEAAIENQMPAYSKDEAPTMILDNLYVSEVNYEKPQYQTAKNYGHAEYQLLSLFNKNDYFYNNGCPFFVVVGTRLPPCVDCENDIRTTRKNYIARTGCEGTYFYVFSAGGVLKRIYGIAKTEK